MYDITDKRQAVFELQRYLRTISHATEGMPHAPTDGFYGDTTRAAVRFFQELTGIPITGNVGFSDWQRIYLYYLAVLRDGAEGSILPPGRLPLLAGDAGWEIFILQALLAAVAEAYADGAPPLRQSGRFDSETGAAVRSFQARRLLPRSGIVDVATWEALLTDYRRTEEMKR